MIGDYSDHMVVNTGSNSHEHMGSALTSWQARARSKLMLQGISKATGLVESAGKKIELSY